MRRRFMPAHELGAVDRVSYESQRPIKMVWRLRYPMSVQMFEDKRRDGGEFNYFYVNA